MGGWAHPGQSGIKNKTTKVKLQKVERIRHTPFYLPGLPDRHEASEEPQHKNPYRPNRRSNFNISTRVNQAWQPPLLLRIFSEYRKAIQG
jgi:hypothetical protein